MFSLFSNSVRLNQMLISINNLRKLDLRCRKCPEFRKCLRHRKRLRRIESLLTGLALYHRHHPACGSLLRIRIPQILQQKQVATTMHNPEQDRHPGSLCCDVLSIRTNSNRPAFRDHRHRNDLSPPFHGPISNQARDESASIYFRRTNFRTHKRLNA